MQTIRNILKIGTSGATLSDEFGSATGVELELMLGTEVTLEFDLRRDAGSASTALPAYPAAELTAGAYYCAFDLECRGSDAPLLLQISGISLTQDGAGHTVFTVPAINTAAEAMVAALSGQSSGTMFCEIGGLDTRGAAIFAWHFPVTVRNRVFSGTGTPAVAGDPAYYTSAQVEAAISRPLCFEYSADGVDWHAAYADDDTLIRARHGETGLPSAAAPIFAGPKGDKGDPGDPLMVYVTGGTGSDITMALTGGTHWTFEQPLEGLTFSSVANSRYESEVIFTGGTALTVDIPASVSVIGEPTFAAGKSYVINVRDNMLVAAEYTPGVE
ncbi:MAG: hypothetical protein MR051_03690 [Lentisphaeria bacterium]|nr:hypothetical protein [Lentisphaeria bacterium]